MEFYSPQGLKMVALLVEDLIEHRKQWSQNALGESLGVSGTTIKNLRLNRLNTDKILHEPHPTLILRLASYITNPLTGDRFDSEDFLRVARGQIVIPISLIGKSVDQQTVLNPAVEFIRAGMHKKTEAQFARACGIPLPEFREILSGRIPTWVELLQLGSQLFEDKNPEPLARLYGVNVNAPISTSAHVK